VWVYNTGAANLSHTYLEFNLPGGTHSIFWGTSRSNAGGGAGFHPPRNGPDDGFQPRHARGL
jgi:hypothetical protein